jgi:signal peptidase I
VLIGAIVALARMTALRWWRIPSDDPYLEASIAPSLRAGDLILLWRLTSPRFGDLVICPEPDAPHRMVIGRIAGEAGDRVSVQGTSVTVNGARAETESACATQRFSVAHPATAKQIDQSCEIEVLGAGMHQRGATSGHPVLPAPVDTTVDPGRVFLLSDNRLLPYDSRDFGTVERATCSETVVFRIFSSQGYFDVDNRFTFIH